jgi:phage recombination protein Bet
MTTDLTVPSRDTELPALRFTSEQIGLIKRQVMASKREPSDDELALFLHHCQRTGLDPLARQIYAIYRYDGRTKDERMTIQTSIDGLRLTAERTGRYLGQAGPWWCGEDGTWREIWTASNPPVAAKVIARKHVDGQIAETPGVALYDEYVQRKDDKPIGLWRDKPALMLAKCAESLALRKAFPQELSNLYTDAEMPDEPQAAPAPVPPPSPGPPKPKPQPKPKPKPERLPLDDADYRTLLDAFKTAGDPIDVLGAALDSVGAPVVVDDVQLTVEQRVRTLNSHQAARVTAALRDYAPPADFDAPPVT